MKKPHKHAALIKAWADGAEIEFLNPEEPHAKWQLAKSPLWFNDFKYRIKPEPRPDKILYKYLTHDGYCCSTTLDSEKEKPTLKLIVDGETGKLKSAEVIND